MSKLFDTLYCTDKNNNIREWNIQVKNKDTFSEIIISHGVYKGQQIVKTIKIESGKNRGKKNETTHFEQAISEATSKWTKKKDTNNYTTQLNLTTETKENQIQQSIEIISKLTPMLAHDYTKFKHKVQFPCYIQRKYDGYRLLYNNITHDMYTRSGKKYTILYNTTLHKQLIEMNLPFDGELYCHNDFNFELYGVLRKKQLTSKDKLLLDKLQYHVYDLNMPIIPYEIRMTHLQQENYNYTSSKIVLVSSILCQNHNDIKTYHDQFVKEGYEGSIIRNRSGIYTSKRSFD